MSIHWTHHDSCAERSHKRTLRAVLAFCVILMLPAAVAESRKIQSTEHSHDPGFSFSERRERNFDAASQLLAADHQVNARAAFQFGCVLSHGLSCAYFVLLLEHGKGGPAEPVRAREIAMESCEAGLTEVCGFAGDLNYYGVGGPPNEDAALRYWLAGCAGNWKLACGPAGILELGRQASHDVIEKRAATLLSQGCDAGYEAACECLAEYGLLPE